MTGKMRMDILYRTELGFWLAQKRRYGRSMGDLLFFGNVAG